MKRTSTPSFVLTLKLNTSASDDEALAYRFLCGARMYNVLVKYCRKQLSILEEDKTYRRLLDKRMDAGLSKTEKNAINQALSDIRMEYGLSMYQLEGYAKFQQHRYRKHIDSLTAQKIADSVWRAVEKYLFGNGRTVHFCRQDDFLSFEGKNNASGIRFKDGHLYWNGLIIQPKYDRSDRYAVESLKHRVKYCRILRRPVGTRYHYYLQLVLEGTPPIKHTYGNDDVGIDIGTSTCAVVSSEKCTLTVLGDDVKRYDQEIARLNRRLDRSRRAVNPGNYKYDGTVKRGRKKWIYSKAYRKTDMKKKSLERRQTDSLKQSQERFSNEVIAQGTSIYVENMSFSGLQRRAKETTINKNGRYNRKSRFGKSLKNHAPSRFLTVLDRKLKYIGTELHLVNTKTFRASQYNHVTDDYVKKKLSCRGQTINGKWIQRDLYSAFLLMNSNTALDHPDRDKCLKTYEAFVKNHDLCINSLLSDNRKHPSSFGLKKVS